MSYNYFSNANCEYYPCHFADQNCLFCFCHEYPYKDCQGTPEFLGNGIKDCSNCTFPHEKENYLEIIKFLGEPHEKD